MTNAAVVTAGPAFLPQLPAPRSLTEERGKHVLEIAGGCGCHGTNFAGWRQGRPDSFPRAAPFGERFVGTFGSVPAANITPDPATGIGGWTDAELATAITDGITPGGDILSPQMPCRAYHGMAHQDVHALIAYLRRLKPVTNDVPQKVLATPPVPSVALPAPPEERPSDTIKLGRYLVENIASCADCHAAGAGVPEGDLLTGKLLQIEGRPVIAPNLTTDRTAGIGSWSHADISHYLRTGTRPDGGLAQSVMAGLVLTSFSRLTPAEASAIAAYLKSLPPSRREVQ